jgi:hypothetical protein
MTTPRVPRRVRVLSTGHHVGPRRKCVDVSFYDGRMHLSMSSSDPEIVRQFLEGVRDGLTLSAAKGTLRTRR